MLVGIPMILNGDILKALCDMGHGDEVVIADANFPAYRCGERVFESPAAGADEMFAAVLKVMPLDHLRGAAVRLMAVEEGDTCGKPPIWESFESLAAESGYAGEAAMLERDAFYKRAARAYAIIRTGESALYGNAIVRKGVVRGGRP